MNPFKSKLLLACSSIILSLLLAEVIISVVKPAPLFRRISFTDSGYTYILSANKKLLYEPKPDAGPFNEYGHRGGAFSLRKDPAKKRLVFLGDSVVEGFTVEPKERFTELLGGKWADKNVEIINLGVEGYSFIQEFEYLKQKALAFHPDMVVWCLTFNDLQEASSELAEIRKKLEAVDRNSFYKEYYRYEGATESVLYKSQVYRYWKLFMKYWTSGRSGRQFENPYLRYLNINEVEQIFQLLPEMAARHDLEFLFVLLPANVGDQQNDLARFEALLKKYKFKYVDLDKYFSARYREKRPFFLVNDPCHLNKKGHGAVADALFELQQEDKVFF